MLPKAKIEWQLGAVVCLSQAAQLLKWTQLAACDNGALEVGE
jgi:hypothetical protein